MNRLFRLTVRQAKTTYDLKPVLFTSLVVPNLLYVLVAGVAYAGIVDPFEIGSQLVGYLPFLVPGIVLVQVSTLATLSGNMLFTDRQQGMLAQLFTLPIPRSYYLLSRVLVTLVSGTAVAVLTFLVSLPLVSGSAFVLTPASVAVSLVALTCLTFWFGVVSMTVSAFLETPDQITVFSRLVQTPLFLVSSVFYPLQYAPEPVRTVSLLNPLTWGADLIRAVLLGVAYPSLVPKATALVGTTLVTVGVGVYVYQRKRISVRR